MFLDPLIRRKKLKNQQYSITIIIVAHARVPSSAFDTRLFFFFAVRTCVGTSDPTRRRRTLQLFRKADQLIGKGECEATFRAVIRRDIFIYFFDKTINNIIPIIRAGARRR
jgi:hypothetical protein